MAIRDKVAMLVSQLGPMVQATGANVAGSGANDAATKPLWPHGHGNLLRGTLQALHIGSLLR